MPARKKRVDLASTLAGSTYASFDGRRAEARYDDVDLAVLGDFAFEKVSLRQQKITRLPRLQPSVKWLSLDAMALASLDGIEQLVGLQRVWLTDLPALDLERACEQLAELPDLTELVLGRATLARMPAGIAKLPSLVSLQLYECAKLDQADAFAKLGKVATLRALEVDVRPAQLANRLAPLAQITSLSVRALGTRVPDSLGAMTSLEKLKIASCAYASLPASIGKLGKLVELDARFTRLEALPDEICECSSLQELNIANTRVKSLPEGIGRLSNLRKLMASSTKLRTVPDSIGQLANLRELWLPWERLEAPDSIYALRLERFHGPSEIAAKMQLAEAPTPQEDRVWIYEADRLPADFGDPIELTVELADHTAPLPQLSQLRRLKEITIDTGNLDDAFARLAGAPHLARLAIVGEHVSLPDSLGLLKQLAHLQISTGSRSYPDRPGDLRELPASIGDLANLESLEIRRTMLRTLPASIGKLAALHRLVLDLGELTELPRALGELRNLRSLSLDLGNVERLPDTLVQCAALEEVSLHASWDDKFPIQNVELLGRLPRLKKLELAGPVFPLDPLLTALAAAPLEHLDLALRVEKLPRSIGKLAQLRRLVLDRTQITKLPPTLAQCTRLQWISVPFYNLDMAYREKLKDDLPKGRWKKNYRSHVTWFERSGA